MLDPLLKRRVIRVSDGRPHRRDQDANLQFEKRRRFERAAQVAAPNRTISRYSGGCPLLAAHSEHTRLTNAP
jgi:hypothetical protein